MTTAQTRSVENKNKHVRQKANLTNPFSGEFRERPGLMIRIMKGSRSSPSTRECALDIDDLLLGQGYVEDVDNKYGKNKSQNRQRFIMDAD